MEKTNLESMENATETQPQQPQSDNNTHLDLTSDFNDDSKVSQDCDQTQTEV